MGGTQRLIQLLHKIKGQRSNLRTISLDHDDSTRGSLSIRGLIRSFSHSGKHWGVILLAVIVVISNFRITLPAGIGGPNAQNLQHYKTIAEIASTATLTQLGNPLYSHEEYTTTIGNDGEYLFKTVETETIISRSARRETIKYLVRSGESVGSLASDFGLTSLTIRYANKLSSNALKVGQELRIPPVDGLFVTIKRGDTLSTIAQRYRVDVDDIIKYNGLLPDEPIHAGNELLIPGAIVPKSSGPSYSRAGNISVPNFSPVPYSGKFIWPTESPTHYISQGYKRYHRGIDLPRTNGWGVYASAPGIVQIKTYRGGYGKLIIINHGGGWSTYYAHLSEYKVSAGQYVEQGQLIAIMGNTGRSTGPHLHFEVRQNGVPLSPLNYLPR